MPDIAKIEAQFRTVAGLRIRYADSGGPEDPVTLLTSPWPESVYAFAPMWATLGDRARLFAIDLPGFGASERRDDLLSPRSMGEPDYIGADYLDCYDGDRFDESMRYVRRYPEELPELAELLPQIATPVSIINGRHDRVVPLANAEFLDERLPTATFDHRCRPLRLGGGARGVLNAFLARATEATVS